MATTAYIVGTPGVSCCACSSTTGCSCGPQNCSVQCESKEGDAELCGFEAFSEPDDPPAKYRRRVIAGLLTKGTWSEPGCPDGEATPTGYGGSFPPNVNFWADSSGSAAVIPVEIDVENNRVKYRMTARAFADRSEGSDGTWGHLNGIAVVFEPADLSGNLVFSNIGDEQWVSRAALKNPHRCFITGDWTLNPGVGHTETEQDVDASNVTAETLIRDTWAQQTDYNETTCEITQEDTSTRYTGGPGPYPLGEGDGTLSGGPDMAAFEDLVDVTSEPLVRTTAGKAECQGGSGAYAQADGEVTETLSVEDTEPAAIARETPALEWDAGGACSEKTTFITTRGPGVFGFSWRIARVRAQLTGLTPGNSYSVTFRFFRRVHGTTDAFVFFSATVITIVASGPSVVTEWEDVPVARGWETRASNCSAAGA